MRDHAAADAFVREALARPFSWTHHNCCTFCAGFVHAYTGVDHLGGEASVSGVRSAIRAVRRYGSLTEAVSAKLGAPKDPRLAAYGDIVLFTGTRGVGDSIGVCAGTKVMVPGETRLEFLPLQEAICAWSISVANSA